MRLISCLDYKQVKTYMRTTFMLGKCFVGMFRFGSDASVVNFFHRPADTAPLSFPDSLPIDVAQPLYCDCIRPIRLLQDILLVVETHQDQ